MFGRRAAGSVNVLVRLTDELIPGLVSMLNDRFVYISDNSSRIIFTRKRPRFSSIWTFFTSRPTSVLLLQLVVQGPSFDIIQGVLKLWTYCIFVHFCGSKSNLPSTCLDCCSLAVWQWVILQGLLMQTSMVFGPQKYYAAVLLLCGIMEVMQSDNRQIMIILYYYYYKCN